MPARDVDPARAERGVVHPHARTRGSTAPADSGTGGGTAPPGCSWSGVRPPDRPRCCCSIARPGPTRAARGPCPAERAATTRHPSRRPCGRRPRKPASTRPASRPGTWWSSTTGPGPTPTCWPRSTTGPSSCRPTKRPRTWPGCRSTRCAATRSTRCSRRPGRPCCQRLSDRGGQGQLTRVWARASRTRAPTSPISIRKPSCPYGEEMRCTGAAAGTAATISSDSRGG